MDQSDAQSLDEAHGWDLPNAICFAAKGIIFGYLNQQKKQKQKRVITIVVVTFVVKMNTAYEKFKKKT